MAKAGDELERRVRGDRSLLLAALGILGFSFTLPLTKIVVRHLDPMAAAAWRAAIASALAAVALRARRRPWPSAGHRRRLLVIAGGIVLGFPFLTAYALRHVPASHGAVFTGLLPLATAGVAVARAHERPSRRYWACSGVGFAAVAAYALQEGGGAFHLADLLLLGAITVAAIAYVEGALLAREMPGWEVISWALVLSTPVTVVVSVVALGTSVPLHVTGGQWLALGYTAAISQFAAFFAWYTGPLRAPGWRAPVSSS